MKRLLYSIFIGLDGEIALYSRKLRKKLNKSLKRSIQKDKLSKNFYQKQFLQIYNYRMQQFYKNGYFDLALLNNRLNHLQKSDSYHISVVTGLLSSIIVTGVFSIAQVFPNITDNEIAKDTVWWLSYVTLMLITSFFTITFIVVSYFYYRRSIFSGRRFVDILDKIEYKILVSECRSRYGLEIE